LAEKINKKLKIMMFTWEFPPRIIGGLSTHVYHLSRSLDRKGVDVQLITCDFPNATPQEINGGIRVSRVNSSGIVERDFMLWIYYMNSLMISKATEILNKESFDIIHAHDWMVARAALEIKNLYNIPLVTTIHATEIGRNRGINFYHDYQKTIHNLENLLICHSERIICCSNYMLRHIETNFGISTNLVSIIPNGVDTLLFHPTPNLRKSVFNLRQQHCIQNGKMLLYVGRLVREKGCDILIDAFKTLNHDTPGTSLIIVGEGPLKQSLMNKVHQLGLQNHIHFMGFVDQQTLVALYKSADVLVIPSLYEPFGIVALEGMASGAPVVSSDVGGLSEVVENGFTGLKVPPGDPDSLVSAIRQVLEVPSLSGFLKINGYEYVLKRYNWDLVAEKTVDTYMQALTQEISPVLIANEDFFVTDRMLLRLLLTLGITNEESSKTAQEISVSIRGVSEELVKIILGRLASNGYISTLIVPTRINGDLAVDIRYHLTENGIISACSDFS
jgi:glycosyltransferase involved in cell wall biosynthesis